MNRQQTYFIKSLIVTVVLFVSHALHAQVTEKTVDSISKEFYKLANEGKSKDALEVNEQLSTFYLASDNNYEYVRT